ncbi:MAG: alpha/beta hydrolase, partial [Clostridiales bacterium]|nr:alpha/beta hydrolase [Clostridiales bacterium]
VRVAQTIHVEDEIERYKGKVFLIHGDADETVPFEYAEKALALYEDAELVPIHGDDHCFTKHLDEMTEALTNFFKREVT